MSENMVDQAVRIKREAEETRTYIRDAMNMGRGISGIRVTLGVRVATGELDAAVLITALVDVVIETGELHEELARAEQALDDEHCGVNDFG